MQQINLIDARLLPPQRLLSSAALIGLVAAAALGVVGHYLAERQWMAVLAASTAPAPAVAEAAAPDGMAALAGELAQREALHGLLKRHHEYPQDSAALLHDLVAALPEALWLTEIDIAGARTLRLTGGTLDPAALLGFAERLARIPALRSLPIATVRLEPLDATQDTGGGNDHGNAKLPSAHRFVLASAAAAAAADAR